MTDKEIEYEIGDLVVMKFEGRVVSDCTRIINKQSLKKGELYGPIHKLIKDTIFYYCDFYPSAPVLAEQIRLHPNSGDTEAKSNDEIAVEKAMKHLEEFLPS